MSNQEKLRFKRPDGSDYPAWDMVRLDEIFENYTEKNSADLQILAATQDKGVIPYDMLDKDIIRKKDSLHTYKKVSKGDFVISLRSFQGGFEYSEYEGIISPAYTILKSKIEIVNYFYKYFFKLDYFINNILFEYVEGIRDGKQIRFEACREMPIPLPCLEEQERIAEFFSALDTKLQMQADKLELLKQYKKGLLQQIFSQKKRFKRDVCESYSDWEVVKLGDVAEIIGGGTPSTANEEFWGGEVQWFTPSEIGKEKYVSISNRTITQLGLKGSSAKILPKGTILLTTRATIGEVAILQNEATTNQGFQSFVCKDNCYNEFLYYAINTIKKELLKRSSGSTFLEISKQNISSIEIKLPCLEEQQKIGKILSAVDHKIALQTEKLESVRQYKKAMLQKMF